MLAFEWIYVYVYVCMYIYIYVYTHIHTHAYVFKCYKPKTHYKTNSCNSTKKQNKFILFMLFFP